EERHARLQRVGHRRTVGLYEQVVDEIDGEVDVLEARKGLGTFGLAVALSIDVDRIELAPALGQRCARLRGEDLLPAVMALERRQVRRPHEALGTIVEARPRARARKPLDDR